MPPKVEKAFNNPILGIARKELLSFFSSPIGYLFLLAFLASVLFVFFWVEAFFARNIADVRPLFEWLPILLIFLSAALTMRMWSEERRAGTLEFVMTVPATPGQFVIGKFIACQTLLIIALAITLPLVVTISVISNLDWGPVIAGYIAATLLGAAYIAIGLHFSARTDNQIVALILAVFACGVCYTIGSFFFTSLFGHELASFLRSLGTGSRFESITRGLLDMRDLVYYLSLAGIFLVLNVHSLRRNSWAASKSSPRQRTSHWITTLAVLNLIVINVWLSGISALRWDLTAGNQYLLSEGTQSYLQRLREPLLIRGYFSAKTHPLLAPLVPQLADLLKEYEIAAGGQARLELIDPAKEPALEEEANTKYNIRPVAFQVSDRYQSSVVSSYFDILFQYGDQYETLGFGDLIEVKARSGGDISVRLRNAEFDLTRAIKKVIQSYQGGASLFDSLHEQLTFSAYVSADQQLPEQLRQIKAEVIEILAEFQAESGGKITAKVLDPRADDGAIAAKIEQDYGFTPMKANPADTQGFYFYLAVSDGSKLIQLPIPTKPDAEAVRDALESGLKSFATGLRQSVAVQTPEVATTNPYQPGQPPLNNEYKTLISLLTNDFEVEHILQPDPAIPAASTGVLVVVDPKNMNQQEVFALDQFLMRGGTLIVASSAFDLLMGSQIFASIPKQTGLEAWLDHKGIAIDKTFVMDLKNAKYPVPVRRQVGPFTFQEMRMLDYPYFADLREDRLNPNFIPTSALKQLTVAWSSPVDVDAAINSERKITTLLTSSPHSWRSANTTIAPKINADNSSPFLPDGALQSIPIAVMVEGKFQSFFEAPPPPEAAEAEQGEDGSEDVETTTKANEQEQLTHVIKRSPDSARLIILGSGAFLSDQVMRSVGSANGTLYTKPAEMIGNLVDWSVEDLALLSIRSRSYFNRTLPPMPENEQKIWEYSNYGIAILAVFLVVGLNWYRTKRRQRRQLTWLHAGRST